jgi:DNA-binding NarL/FixJ family response regulator
MRSNRLIKSGKHYRYLLHLKSGHDASNRCGVWSQLCLGEIATEPVPNEQEWRVMKFVAQGLKNTEIAEAMGTRRDVIANYLRSMCDKLGLWNRVELALWYEARKHRQETMN